MTFQKGNKFGNRFNSEKQPDNPGRPQGTKNRSTIAKKWLDTITEWDNPITGVKERISLEDQITLAQIKAAREGNGGNAYKVILDSAYGNTKQEVDLVGEIKVTDNRLTIEVVEPADDDDED